VIRVAVVASSPMTQARLEALVVALPGLRLVSPPSLLAVTRGYAMDAVIEADVVLVDPGSRPAETVLRGLSQAPRLPPVVLLAGSDHAPAASGRLLRAGARAILPLDATAPDIAAAIEAVLAGLIVLHPSTAPISVTRATAARRARDEAGTDPLTPRELEILTMMGEGMSNRAIAQRLGISSHTVKFHIASILDKLNARSRTDAVMIGMRLGLLMV
jgi:two-component system, NarL family, response regulator YdfI